MQSDTRCPDAKAKFFALIAKFNDLNARFWQTSDLSERAALLRETHSILLDADKIVREGIDSSWNHLQRLAHEYQKLCCDSDSDLQRVHSESDRQ